MTGSLDDHLLQQFMHTFYGYGNYDAPFWFVGMEEGGRDTVPYINRRLRLWAERGKRELEDLAEWHLAEGPHRHFTGRPPLQPTWNRLMRILLTAKGESPTISALRTYQKEKLGRTGGESCLVELFPLPAKSTGSWFYGEHSRLPQLANRKRYRQALAPQRVRHLRSRLLVHRPQHVIFYSTNARYRRWWQKIARTDFQQISDKPGDDPPLYQGHDGHTTFIICRHPVSVGITNDYFHRIGRILRQ